MIFDDFEKIMKNNDFRNDQHMYHLYDLEESASHPLPLLEGVPQVQSAFKVVRSNLLLFMPRRLNSNWARENMKRILEQI